MSNKTYAYLEANDLVLKYLCISDPRIDRCAALVDFRHHPGKKSGENIASWISSSHAEVMIKPSYMFSHVVDNGDYCIVLSCIN